MLKKLVKTYYKLLDEKLENGTVVVLLVAVLIVSASILTKDTDALMLVKNNILETNKKIVPSSNIIEINGIKYEIVFKELSN